MATKKPIKMTWVRAAEIVLSRSSKPLHSFEIVEKAISLGLMSPKGKLPDHTVQGAIWKDIHTTRKVTSPFVMLRPGRVKRLYWLKAKKIPKGFE